MRLSSFARTNSSFNKRYMPLKPHGVAALGFANCYVQSLELLRRDERQAAMAFEELAQAAVAGAAPAFEKMVALSCLPVVLVLVIIIICHFVITGAGVCARNQSAEENHQASCQPTNNAIPNA